jgi:hypothetical protein
MKERIKRNLSASIKIDELSLTKDSDVMESALQSMDIHDFTWSSQSQDAYKSILDQLHKLKSSFLIDCLNQIDFEDTKNKESIDTIKNQERITHLTQKIQLKWQLLVISVFNEDLLKDKSIRKHMPDSYIETRSNVIEMIKSPNFEVDSLDVHVNLELVSDLSKVAILSDLYANKESLSCLHKLKNTTLVVSEEEKKDFNAFIRNTLNLSKIKAAVTLKSSISENTKRKISKVTNTLSNIGKAALGNKKPSKFEGTVLLVAFSVILMTTPINPLLIPIIVGVSALIASKVCRVFVNKQNVNLNKYSKASDVLEETVIKISEKDASSAYSSLNKGMQKIAQRNQEHLYVLSSNKKFLKSSYNGLICYIKDNASSVLDLINDIIPSNHRRALTQSLLNSESNSLAKLIKETVTNDERAISNFSKK